MAASKEVEWIHDRMPVILPYELMDKWLNPDIPLDEILSLLKPYYKLAWHKVTPRIEDEQFESPECVKALEEEKEMVLSENDSNESEDTIIMQDGPTVEEVRHGPQRRTPSYQQQRKGQKKCTINSFFFSAKFIRFILAKNPAFKRLEKLFGSVLDEEILQQVYDENKRDLNKTIEAVIT